MIGDWFAQNALLAGAAFAVVFLLVAIALLVRQILRWQTETRRLTDDVHNLLGSTDADARIQVNGRQSEFVDITATINRLLDRAVEDGGDAQESLAAAFNVIGDTIPDVTLIHTDKILYANPVAGEMVGLDASLLRGKAASDLLRPAYRPAFMQRIMDSAAADFSAQPLEVQLINGDERGLWADLYTTRFDLDGMPAFITVARNITDRKSLEASVGRGKLQARVTLESIGAGIITTDIDGRIDYMNESAEQLMAISRSLAVGRTLPDLAAIVDESDGESLGDPVAQCLQDGRRIHLGRRALLMVKQEKREFSVDLTASPIQGPDREVVGCVVIFTDVTEMRGFARELSYQASHDALTGLVNRAEFQRRLEQALQAPREGTGHVVCYLDLDRFKVVNDTCGHMVGDNLLREIAALLKDQVRDSDTVARFGGDEFAMLLAGCPLDKARQIADDVCQAVTDYKFTWNDRVFDLGVSIGLVQVSQETASAESALSAADSACYVAKQQGRGRIHVYSARDEMVSRERGEIQWLQRLQTALSEHKFELFVQPVIALNSKGARGPAAELLLRMRDDDGKLIAPSQFLPAAERYQLMAHIDRWVVRAALTGIANGSPPLPEGRLCCINLSGQTLADEDFLEFVVDLLDHTGVSPDKLCFEVPEGAILNNIDHARRFVSVLHGIGCRFGLDDFASGVGSLSNLKQLAVDYVKVDGSNTRDLEENSVNWELLGAMVRLARSLDFHVIAEQVEDQESFDRLRKLGVDFAQGFVVDRPRPLASRDIH